MTSLVDEQRPAASLYTCEVGFDLALTSRFLATVATLQNKGYPSVVDALVAVGVQPQSVRIHASLFSFRAHATETPEKIQRNGAQLVHGAFESAASDLFPRIRIR